MCYAIITFFLLLFNVGWTASKNETTFGIGCKYALDKEASVRAKINNSSHVGLSYQHKLRDGKYQYCRCNLDTHISSFS